MYQVVTFNKFLKDLKLLKNRISADFKLLQNFVNHLAKFGAKEIEQRHKPHKLKGEFGGYWECHVNPDLLLIWDESDKLMLLELGRTGTHSDLFK